MRIRIKTKWSKEEREVSLEDAVSVLAFNSWKIGMQTLLEIENEDFQIDTQHPGNVVTKLTPHGKARLVFFFIPFAVRVAFKTLV